MAQVETRSAAAMHAEPEAQAAAEAGVVAPVNTAPVSEHDGLLTQQQAAVLLGLSTSSLVRLTRAGKVPAFRLGWRTVRYSRVDLLAYLASKRTVVVGEVKAA
jgi:excisionase family DNA binding protein